MTKIINMEQQHITQIADLEKLCFSDPWSERSVTEELTNPLALWLVCLDGSNVIGYVGSQTVMDESDMMNIAVHPDYRRKGIAEHLILELIRKLERKGSRCLSLEVRVSNIPAIALYEKLGFVTIGRRPKYYRNPREDALILRKEWTL